jgi:hypothetical protein
MEAVFMKIVQVNVGVVQSMMNAVSVMEMEQAV